MKRRTFLQVAAATAASLKPPSMRAAGGIAKREYKDGVKLSVRAFWELLRTMPKRLSPSWTDFRSIRSCSP